MAHVAIFRAAFSKSEDVEALVGSRLQLVGIERALLEETSRRFGVTTDKLLRAMIGPDFVFNKFTRRRELHLAQLKKVLSEMLAEDKRHIGGFASHLIPRTLHHVLRVCMLDDPETRAKVAAAKRGIPEKQARNLIRDEDARCAAWTDYLYGAPPWDRTLYDLKIPVLTLGVSPSADLIVDAAGRLADISSDAAARTVTDFQIAQTAELALAEAGLFHAVTCDERCLVVTVNEYVAFFERLETEIRSVVEKTPNVDEVKVVVGPHFRPATMFGEADILLPKKVLLVDDERDFVLTLSERLELRDAAPSVAFTGEEALTMTAEEAPDVMILDLKMPGIDGIEVLKRVKAEHADVEVIILTGHGSPEDKERCLALGAFEYLEKPVDIDVLADAMRRAAQAIASKLKRNS